MAATTAIESEFPFIKVITPENYVGYTEQVRRQEQFLGVKRWGGCVRFKLCHGHC